MTPKLFISYRRSDAVDAARALCFQLRMRFGASKVFMDESSIQPGDAWPERIQQALSDSSVVLALIGPGWLTAADTWGRRRLDDDSDWVRQELSTALQRRVPVIPMLLAGLSMPPKAALPDTLQSLCDCQAYSVGHAHWEDDVRALCRHLTHNHGLQPLEPDVVLPLALPEKKTLPALTDRQLFEALQALPAWEPVETNVAADYPKSRVELRRTLRFKRFKDAIAFLQTIVTPLNALNHHPRIENQWRTVFIHFTTWDAGNRLTERDIEAAKQVEALYQAFQEALKG